MGSDWLSLKDACRILDVSDTTLRHWADAGHLRVYRTPGKHRRFLRQDVEALAKSTLSQPGSGQAESPEGPTLRRIRRRLSQDKVTREPWFQAVEPEGHQRMRLFGRRLLSLLLQQPGPRRRRQELLDEATLLGQEYGTEMMERNVALTDSVEAFVFFRTMVLDNAPQNIWANILEMSDRVLSGLCSAYQRGGQHSQGDPPSAASGGDALAV